MAGYNVYEDYGFDRSWSSSRLVEAVDAKLAQVSPDDAQNRDRLQTFREIFSSPSRRVKYDAELDNPLVASIPVSRIREIAAEPEELYAGNVLGNDFPGAHAAAEPMPLTGYFPAVSDSSSTSDEGFTSSEAKPSAAKPISATVSKESLGITSDSNPNSDDSGAFSNTGGFTPMTQPNTAGNAGNADFPQPFGQSGFAQQGFNAQGFNAQGGAQGFNQQAQMPQNGFNGFNGQNTGFNQFPQQMQGGQGFGGFPAGQGFPNAGGNNNPLAALAGSGKFSFGVEPGRKRHTSIQWLIFTLIFFIIVVKMFFDRVNALDYFVVMGSMTLIYGAALGAFSEIIWIIRSLVWRFSNNDAESAPTAGPINQ